MARPVSLGTRYTRIRNTIKQSLESRGMYDPADDLLLTELMYAVKVIDDCKQNIKKRGYEINTVKDPEKPPYYQQNPAVGTYNKTVANLTTILTKLGITPQERAKLEIEKGEKSDELGDLIRAVKVSN